MGHSWTEVTYTVYADPDIELPTNAEAIANLDEDEYMFEYTTLKAAREHYNKLLKRGIPCSIEKKIIRTETRNLEKDEIAEGKESRLVSVA